MSSYRSPQFKYTVFHILWLAIRFKITTGYTRVFLPRILVYIRYVWVLSKDDRLNLVYTHFERATYLRKFKRGNMRNECPNIRVLQGPIYTRAKMRAYAGLVNYVLYASTKCACLREWLFVYDSNENTLSPPKITSLCFYKEWLLWSVRELAPLAHQRKLWIVWNRLNWKSRNMVIWLDCRIPGHHLHLIELNMNGSFVSICFLLRSFEGYVNKWPAK